MNNHLKFLDLLHLDLRVHSLSLPPGNTIFSEDIEKEHCSEMG